MAAAKKVTILSAIVPIPRKDGTSFTALRDQVVAVPSAVAAQLIADGHAVAGTGRKDQSTQEEADQSGQPPAEEQPASDKSVSKGGDGPAANPDGDTGDPAAPPPADEQPASEATVSKSGDGPAAEPTEPGDADEGAEGEEGDSEPETAPSVPKPPKAGPVAAWREYAVAQGHDPDEAADATRADLIALYG